MLSASTDALGYVSHIHLEGQYTAQE